MRASEPTTPRASDARAVGDERRRATHDAWQARDVVALLTAGALYALSGLFYWIAVLLEVLAKIPGFKYAFANAVIGAIVAILFGAFIVLGFLLTVITEPFGVSDQAAAGAAGAVVVAIPILGALGFVWLAIATRTDGG